MSGLRQGRRAVDAVCENTGGRRGLANLHVVFGGELHEALEACAGMLRALAS